MSPIFNKIFYPKHVLRIFTYSVAHTSALHLNKVRTVGRVNLTPKLFNAPLRCGTAIKSVRNKSSKKIEQDSDDEDEFADDSSLNRDSKIVKINTTSLRADLILKSVHSVARNKVEQLFYESKIRLNGKKILKKSVSVRPGDEIDIIKSISPKNPNHLYISRIEVMSVAAKEDSIEITARRFKSLLIENYDIDPYKTSADSDTP